MLCNIFGEIDWAVVAGAVTGLGTLYLAFVTKNMVGEIKAQRTTPFRPVLDAGNQPIYFIAHSFSDVTVITDFSNISYEGTLGGYDFKRTYSASCILYNGGFGAAKEAEYPWEYKIREMIGKAEELDPNKKYNFELGKWLNFRCHGKTIIAGAIEVDRKSFGGGFVMPPGDDKIPLGNHLRIPAAYLLSVAALIDLSVATGKIADIPTLKLNIWYRDIERTPFFKKFIISVEIGTITHLPQAGITGYMEVGRHQLFVSEIQSK